MVLHIWVFDSKRKADFSAYAYLTPVLPFFAIMDNPSCMVCYIYFFYMLIFYGYLFNIIIEYP